MPVMPRNIHIYTQIKELGDVLGLTWQNLLDEKNGYIGGRGNFESIMLPWLPIFMW